MPTVHHVKRKSLKHIGLPDWCISVDANRNLPKLFHGNDNLSKEGCGTRHDAQMQSSADAPSKGDASNESTERVSGVLPSHEMQETTGIDIESSETTEQTQMSDTTKENTIHPKEKQPRIAAAAGVFCLKRKNNALIWVEVGHTTHPAYELQNPHNPSSDSGSSSSTVWVEWASNGKKESIFRHQIVKGGLGARHRHKPNYFTENP